MWLPAACGSAFFAGITAILAKCGIRKTDSDIATAIRTIIVLLFSWCMVFIAGSFHTITEISGKSLFFLILSGLSTGASWICYFKALSMGDVNKVVPIDKSSTVLTVLMAIIIFRENNHLAIKLLCTGLIGAGVLMMVEKKENGGHSQSGWMFYAILSAVFAAATSLLAKAGISGVESNLATAIRTCVVLAMAWLIVGMKQKLPLVKTISPMELIFLVLSGFTTGASWLCYYYAIQTGIVSVVVPVDKLSIIVSIIFSRIVFKEKLNRKAFAGLAFMVCGTLVMAVFA